MWWCRFRPVHVHDGAPIMPHTSDHPIRHSQYTRTTNPPYSYFTVLAGSNRNFPTCHTVRRTACTARCRRRFTSAIMSDVMSSLAQRAVITARRLATPSTLIYHNFCPSANSALWSSRPRPHVGSPYNSFIKRLSLSQWLHRSPSTEHATLFE